MTLVTRSSFNLIPRPCRRNCYGHSCDWPACRPRNAARGARARARAKRDSDSRTHLANPIGLDQNKATSSPKRRDVSKWAISIPGFRRRCYVRDTPASFCSPPAVLLLLLLFVHVLLVFLLFPLLVSVAARSGPVVAAFTRDAMPPDARSSRRGAAKNDHQVSRLPLCTHVCDCARARARVSRSRTQLHRSSFSFCSLSFPCHSNACRTLPPSLHTAAAAAAAAVTAAAAAVPLSQQ